MTTAMTADVLWPVCRCGQIGHPDAVRRRLIHHELYHNYWVSGLAAHESEPEQAAAQSHIWL